MRILFSKNRKNCMEADQNEEKSSGLFLFAVMRLENFFQKKDGENNSQKQRRNCDTILRIREKRKTFHTIFLFGVRNFHPVLEAIHKPEKIAENRWTNRKEATIMTSQSS